MEKSKEPIQFKYNANAYIDEIFKKADDCICDCCGEKAEYVYSGAIYKTGDERPNICPKCMANGDAARKYHAQFVSSCARDVNDPDKVDELLHRTPGYPSWQGDYFPGCCNDFCTFIGDVGTEELEEMGIADEVFDDYELRGGDPYVRDTLVAVGSTAGYLFRCLHCGAYHLHVDMD